MIFCKMLSVFSEGEWPVTLSFLLKHWHLVTENDYLNHGDAELKKTQNFEEKNMCRENFFCNVTNDLYF